MSYVHVHYTIYININAINFFLGDDEYPNMICVESGHVSSGVTLMPGTAFEASQILQVM